MANVYVEARPKGRPAGIAREHSNGCVATPRLSRIKMGTATTASVVVA